MLKRLLLKKKNDFIYLMLVKSDAVEWTKLLHKVGINNFYVYS